MKFTRRFIRTVNYTNISALPCLTVPLLCAGAAWGQTSMAGGAVTGESNAAVRV